MIFEKKVLDTFSSTLLKRADDTGAVFYYSHEDFPELKSEPYSFIGNRGQRLNGAVIYYGEKNGKTVIFEHGMGGGYRSYMKEIELIAAHGYTVITYDHTGCMTSEGEHIGGFSQSLADLDCLISSLSALDEYKNSEFYVVGHSWGAFSTLNISALHPSVKKIVAISGFISLKQILRQYLKGALRLYIPAIIREERKVNGKYADYNALSSLENSNVSALIIHSKDDPAVDYSKSFKKLEEKFGSNEQFSFLTLSGKAHNPNYTEDAVKYKDEFVAKLSAFYKSEDAKEAEMRARFKSQFDWERMTKQDDTVWQRIFYFLDK